MSRIAPMLAMHRRSRGALLLGTALQASALLVVTLPVRAQPAPGAHPLGGQVVAGQATISTGGATTLINQTTPSTSINWQSFDVGAGQAVVFRQPGTNSLALNRVTGPDPSVIAGRITANGQIVLINQSGVLFTRGSQVDTAGLVVSAAGMSDKNFAAGRLVFDRAAHPGALVSNAGNITVRQAGLAALVAPQVANSGLITARLGHVVLAGAETATLDLYGDRLVSLNVTGAVRAVSVGGRIVPALVTNSGTILAEGGTVLLTARDADALVSRLVMAGGTISADSGGRGGQVLVEGVGGSVEIAGTLSARGTGSRSKGGAVGVTATGDVVLDRGALIDASGTRAGGTVALGTTLARARHGSGVPKHGAARVLIAEGAVVRADSTGSGAGGRVAVIGLESIMQAGAISVRGAGAGDGGAIELSGNGSFAITGTENAGAVAGKPGSITIDPAFVEITDSAPDAGYTAIATSTVDGMTGTVIVMAGNTLKLLSDVTLGSGATGFELKAGKDLVLSAAFNAGDLAGTFTSGTLGIQQTAGLITAGSLDLETTGAVTQTGGTVAVGTLKGSVAGLSLPGANTIDTLAALTSTGNVDIATGGTLQVTGALDAGSHTVTLTGTSISLTDTVTAGRLDLIATGGDITQTSAGVIDAGTLTASAVAGGGLAGQILLDTASNGVGTLGLSSAAAGFSLGDTLALTVARNVSAGASLALATPSLTLSSGSSLTVANAGLVSLAADAFTLTGSTITATAGTVALGRNSSGTFSVGTSGTLDPSALGVITAGTLALGTRDGVNADANVTTLTIGGALDSSAAAPVLALFAESSLVGTGVVTATTLRATAGMIALSGANDIGTVALLSAAGDILLDDAQTLKVSGSATSAGGGVSLGVTGTGNNLDIGASVSGTQVTLSSAKGSVTEKTGGSVTGTTLTASAGKSLTLGLSNLVGTVAGLTGAGILFDDGQTLAVAGPVSGGSGAVTIHVTGSGHDLDVSAGITGGTLDLAAAGNLAIGGTLSATGATLAATAGSITETGGAIALGAGTLVATAGNGIDLGSATNDFTGLGASDAGTGAFVLADSAALTVAGNIAAGPTIALTSTALTLSAGITLAVAANGLVSLAADAFALTGSTITASGGVVAFDRATAGTFSLKAGGTLDPSALGSITAGTLAFGTRDGVIQGTATALSVGAALDAGSIPVLALFGGATLSDTGPITATTLTASAGAITLDGSNAIDTVTLLNATGDLVLDDTKTLVVAGPVTGGTVTLAVSGAGNDLDIGGSVSGTRITLSSAAGAVTETGGGSVTGTTLTASAGTSLSLGLTNMVGTVAGLTGVGIVFDDGQTLAVAGPVAGGSGAVTIRVTGSGNDLDISADITAGTALDLKAAGNLAIGGTLSGTDATLAATSGSITETGGAILLTTGSLSASAGDGIALASATNSFSNLGTADAGTGAFAVRDSTALTVVAGIAANSSLGVTSTALTLASGATLDVSTGLVSLAADSFALSGSTITATGGIVAFDRVTAGTFTVGAGGTLDPSTLGSIAAGTLALGSRDGVTAGTDVTTLTVAGAFDPSAIAPALALFAVDEISGAASITVGTLSASAGTIMLAGANAVGTLAGLTAAGDIVFDDAQTLVVAGPVAGGTVTLAVSGAGGDLSIGGSVSGTQVTLSSAAGTVREAAGGSVTGTTLTASAGTSLSLGGANMVGTVAGLTGIGILFDDGQTLAVTGPVSGGAGAVAIHVTGSGNDLDVSAGVTAGTTLDLAAAHSLSIGGTLAGTGATLAATAGSIAEAGGAILLGAGTLVANAGSGVTLGSSANTLSALGASDAGTGTFTLFDSTALTLTSALSGSAVALHVTSGGVIEQSSAGITATTLSASASSSLVLASGLNAVGTLGVLSAGQAIDFEEPGAIVLSDNVTAGTNATLTASAVTQLAGTVSAPGALAITARTGSLAFGGVLSSATATLVAGTDITETLPSAASPTGAVIATSLSGSAGNVALFTTPATATQPNQVGTLAGFTATNGFSLVDAGGLTIAGTGSGTGGTISLAAPTLTITGTLSDTAIVLDAGAGGIDASLGSIDTASLSGLSGAGALFTGTNHVAAVTGFSAATVFALQTAGTLSITGTLHAPQTVTLASTDGDLAIGAPISSASVSLTAAQAIAETLPGATAPTGTVLAGTLSGSAGGTVALDTPSGNRIGTLAGFSAGPGFSIVDDLALLVTGTVTSTGLLAIKTPGLTLSSTLSDATGTVSLALGTGGVTGTDGGIDAATLTGSAGGTVLLDGANAIGTLAAFTSGTFTLADGTGLMLAGVLSAPAVTLDVTGPIDEIAGGSIATTLLAATATGSIQLAAANAVGTVTGIGAGGRLVLDDAGPLVLAGTVTAGADATLTASGSLTQLSGVLDAAGPLALTAPSIAFGGVVEAPGQLVTLVASGGDITETLPAATAPTGTLIAGTLTGSATGNLHLDTATGNAIDMLAGFAAGGDLTLSDSVAPTVTGLVMSGQDIALTVAPGTTGTLVLAGTLTAPGTFSLVTPGDVTQTAGFISAPTLTASIGGALDLGSATNTIARLGAVSAGTNLSVSDGTGVMLTGPVSAGGNIQVMSSGSILIAGALTDTAGITTLLAGGDATSSATATLDVATLSGAASGALNLTAGIIHLGTLANVSAGSTIDVADLDTLTLAGQVTASGNRAVLTAPEIDVAGTLALPGAGLISLAADRFVFGGQVTTPSGTIALSRLTAGVFSVGAGASTADLLSGLQTGVGTGRVAIGSRDGTTGDPTTTAIAMTVPADFTGAPNGTGTLVLLAPGDITSSGGLAVGVLTATSSAGNIAITGPDAVPVLGALAAAGSIAFEDTTDLALTADITGPAGVTLAATAALSVGATVTVAGANVALTGGDITLAGTLAAPTGTVTLDAAGAITEAGGTILADTLAGPAPGGVLQDGTLSLLSATNRIGTLGALSGSGDFLFRDETALTIAGPAVFLGQASLTIDGPGNGILATGTLQSAGALSLTVPAGLVQTGGLLASDTGITIQAASLQFAGTIQSGGTTAITVEGDLLEAATGSLDTALLQASAGGSLSLSSDTNAIGTVTTLQADALLGSGDLLALHDQTALTVVGPVTSLHAGGVALADAQSLTLTGNVVASSVQLTAASIAQSATSAITAETLTGSSAGNAILTGENTVAQLGPFTAGGVLSIVDRTATVQGALSAGGALTLSVQGDLLVQADIGGAGVSLSASAAFRQAAGTLRGTGITVAAGSITQNAGSAMTLSGTGSVLLAASGGDVALAGRIAAASGSVRVTTPGNFSETGQLAAGTLSGTAGGQVAVGGAGASIAVARLADFAARGAFTLGDGADLVVDGPVSAGGSLALSVSGAGTAMTLDGVLSAPTISLAAAQTIDQTAGDIAAGSTARLDAAGTITLAGTLSGPVILIGNTVAPALLAWDNNTLVTSSDLARGERLTALPAADGSRPGIFVRTAALTQTGTTRINPSGAPATLEVLLTEAGKITLDPSLSAGLIAPSTFAFFSLGGGTASGNVNLASLDVEYANTGTGSPTRFTGLIAGVGGTSAAGFGTIGPRPNQEYQINGCPIASTNCVLLSPLVVPVQNPVLEVSFDPPRRRRDDDELVLPNVAEQDY